MKMVVKEEIVRVKFEEALEKACKYGNHHGLTFFKQNPLNLLLLIR